MTLIYSYRSLQAQPVDHAFDINWASSLTQDMWEFALATPQGLRTAAGNLSTQGGVTPVGYNVRKPGIGRRSNAVSSVSFEQVAVRSLGALQDYPGFTVYARGLIGATNATAGTSYGTSRIVFGWTVNDTASTVDNGIGIAQSGTGGLIGVSSVTSNRVTGAVTVGNATSFDAFVMLAPDGVLSFEVVGVGTGTPAASSTITVSTQIDPNFRTGFNASTASPGDKTVFCGAAWTRMLTPSERHSIAFNPWQLIKVRRPSGFVFTGAPVDPVLSNLVAISITASGATPQVDYVA